MLNADIRTLVIRLASLAVGAGISCQAQAGVLFALNYVDPSGNAASGVITANDNFDGTYTAISGTLNITASTTAGAVGSYLLLPGSGTSPAGAFIFDSLMFYQVDPFLDIDGLLFTNADRDEVNLWGNGPGNYSLYTWETGLGYALQCAGTAASSIIIVPGDAEATIAVSSSANPSPIGSNVTFTAILTAVTMGSGTPTGTVRFFVDGSPLGPSALLADGVASGSTSSLSQGTHVITVQYAGDGNFLGSTNSLSPNESIETAPAAPNIVLQRYQNSDVKVSIPALLTGDSGPNTGSLSLISVSVTSTAGGTVTVTNNWIFYAPPPGLTNSDTFSYVIANPAGLKATGLISITVPADLGQSQNIVAIGNPGKNASLIQFQGIVGRTYSIQYTESLVTPAWQTLGAEMSDATGGFEFTDTKANGAPARFYRSSNL